MSPLNDLPESAWLALSALAGAAVTLVLGFLNLRGKGADRIAVAQSELSAGQRDWIRIQQDELSLMHAKLADMDHALAASQQATADAIASERESCDLRMQQMDEKYSRQIEDLKRRMGNEERR